MKRKRSERIEKIIAVFTIYLMLSLIIASAQGVAYSPQENQNFEKSWGDVAIDFLDFLLPGVAAADTCCIRTTTNSYCVEDINSGDCDVPLEPGSCADVPECNVGTCVQQNGDCDYRYPEQKCDDNFGEWIDRPLFEINACTPTCCIFTDEGKIVDTESVAFRNKCERLPQFDEEGFNLERQDISRIACEQLVDPETKGYCTIEARATCEYITKEECDSREGEFSNQRCDSCQPNFEQECFNGEQGYGVYAFDSCGGPGNLLDGCALNEVCEEDEDTEIASCEEKTCPLEIRFTNLGYSTSYFQAGEVEIDGVFQGNRVNKKVQAGTQEAIEGYELGQGEQACIRFQGPGEQHYVATCIFGEMQVFGIDDQRTTVCGFDGTNAYEEENRYQECQKSGQDKGIHEYGLGSFGSFFSGGFSFLGADLLTPKWWDKWTFLFGSPGLSTDDRCDEIGADPAGIGPSHCVSTDVYPLDSPTGNNDCVPRYAPANQDLCNSCSTTDASSPWDKCGEPVQCTSLGYCAHQENKANVLASATICLAETTAQTGLLTGIRAIGGKDKDGRFTKLRGWLKGDKKNTGQAKEAKSSFWRLWKEYGGDEKKEDGKVLPKVGNFMRSLLGVPGEIIKKPFEQKKTDPNVQQKGKELGLVGSLLDRALTFTEIYFLGSRTIKVATEQAKDDLKLKKNEIKNAIKKKNNALTAANLRETDVEAQRYSSVVRLKDGTIIRVYPSSVIITNPDGTTSLEIPNNQIPAKYKPAVDAGRATSAVIDTESIHTGSSTYAQRQAQNNQRVEKETKQESSLAQRLKARLAGQKGKLSDAAGQSAPQRKGIQLNLKSLKDANAELARAAAALEEQRKSLPQLQLPTGDSSAADSSETAEVTTPPPVDPNAEAQAAINALKKAQKVLDANAGLPDVEEPTPTAVTILTPEKKVETVNELDSALTALKAAKKKTKKIVIPKVEDPTPTQVTVSLTDEQKTTLDENYDSAIAALNALKKKVDVPAQPLSVEEAYFPDASAAKSPTISDPFIGKLKLSFKIDDPATGSPELLDVDVRISRDGDLKWNAPGLKNDIKIEIGDFKESISDLPNENPLSVVDISRNPEFSKMTPQDMRNYLSKNIDYNNRAARAKAYLEVAQLVEQGRAIKTSGPSYAKYPVTVDALNKALAANPELKAKISQMPTQEYLNQLYLFGRTLKGDLTDTEIKGLASVSSKIDRDLRFMESGKAVTDLQPAPPQPASTPYQSLPTVQDVDDVDQAALHSSEYYGSLYNFPIRSQYEQREAGYGETLRSYWETQGEFGGFLARQFVGLGKSYVVSLILHLMGKAGTGLSLLNPQYWIKFGVCMPLSPFLGGGPVGHKTCMEAKWVVPGLVCTFQSAVNSEVLSRNVCVPTAPELMEGVSAGFDNCARCHEDPYPCTAGRCQALSRDASCVYDPYERQCFPDPEKVKACDQTKRTPMDIEEINGEKVVNDRFIERAIPYEDVIFEVEVKTNIAATCKYSLNKTEGWSNMETLVAGRDYKLHNVTVDIFDPERSNFTYFVLCQDICRKQRFSDVTEVNLVKEEKPDEIGPVITDKFPAPDTPIEGGSNRKKEVVIKVETDEPAECKWKRWPLAEGIDTFVGELENIESIASNLLNVGASQDTLESELSLTALEWNDPNLTAVQYESGVSFAEKHEVRFEDDDALNNSEIYAFVFLCRDGKANLGEVPGVVRFKVSELFDVEISEPRNTTVESKPSLKVSTDRITSCRYSIENKRPYGEMNGFIDTGGTSHRTNIDKLLSFGEHEVFVSCLDEEGFNLASDEQKFSVVEDRASPRIVRAYKDSDTLLIATDELTSCQYSFKSFTYGEGSDMTGNNPVSVEHRAEWRPETTYHLVCRDRFGNVRKTSLKTTKSTSEELAF